MIPFRIFCPEPEMSPPIEFEYGWRTFLIWCAVLLTTPAIAVFVTGALLDWWL